MHFDRTNFSDEELVGIYEALVWPRMIEDKMLILLRQSKISKWFSGIGQEAVAVGTTLALEPDEYILPMHRNLGVFTTRNVPFERLFAQFQGKKSGFTKGRDRSFHFGTQEHYIVGMISHLGPQMALADGIALAHKLDREQKVALVFTGDGASSEGDFHEALNVAAVWDLPVIFVVENNGYGLSTPSNEQFRFRHFIDKGPGYGMEAVQIDGNNILEVYSTISRLATELRENPRPVLVEALTFRMRGHEEASGTKYVPQELFDQWAKKDPVENYERFLMERGILSPEQRDQIRSKISKEIETGLQNAFAEPEPEASTTEEVDDMYAPFEQQLIAPASQQTEERRFIDAISDGLRQSMQRFPGLVLMGQDIAEYGGVFKITTTICNIVYLTSVLCFSWLIV